MVPGAAAADARVTRADGRDDWLLRQLGDGFTALVGADARRLEPRCATARRLARATAR